jgi:hypothetical protein
LEVLKKKGFGNAEMHKFPWLVRFKLSNRTSPTSGSNLPLPMSVHPIAQLPAYRRWVKLSTHISWCAGIEGLIRYMKMKTRPTLEQVYAILARAYTQTITQSMQIHKHATTAHGTSCAACRSASITSDILRSMFV